MKRITILVICFIIFIYASSLTCYSEKEHLEFERHTGFVIEDIDVNYSNKDFYDYKVCKCDKNGVLLYANNLNRDPYYIYLNYNGDVVECNLYDKKYNNDNDKLQMFKDGFAKVETENGLYGFINMDYQWVVPPIYSFATSYSNGFASASLGNRTYLFNNQGQICMNVDYFIRPYYQYDDAVFSNGYAVYINDNEIYYLNEKLDSIKINEGAKTNHKYDQYVFEGGTLVYVYADIVDSECRIGYKIFDHNGKISYEHKTSIPIDEFDSLTDFMDILHNGIVILEEPEDFEDFLNIHSKSRYTAISVSGEALGETEELYTRTPHNAIWSIDDKIINFANIYDSHLRRIEDSKWAKGMDCIFYSNDGDVFGGIILSESDDSPAKIDKIRLIRGKDTQLNREGKVVDPAKIPENINDTNDKVSVYINNQQIEFDSAATMENDRTLVPMRRIFEELGADVSWDNETNTAIAKKGDVEIELCIDSDVMIKNGEQIKLDTPARLIDDAYTFVPLRAVSEAFGCTVKWTEELKRIDILTAK